MTIRQLGAETRCLVDIRRDARAITAFLTRLEAEYPDDGSAKALADYARWKRGELVEENKQ